MATTTKEHRTIVFNKVTNGISQKHYEKYGHIQSLDGTGGKSPQQAKGVTLVR